MKVYVDGPDDQIMWPQDWPLPAVGAVVRLAESRRPLIVQFVTYCPQGGGAGLGAEPYVLVTLKELT